MSKPIPYPREMFEWLPDIRSNRCDSPGCHSPLTGGCVLVTTQHSRFRRFDERRVICEKCATKEDLLRCLK